MTIFWISNSEKNNRSNSKNFKFLYYFWLNLNSVFGFRSTELSLYSIPVFEHSGWEIYKKISNLFCHFCSSVFAKCLWTIHIGNDFEGNIKNEWKTRENAGACCKNRNPSSKGISTHCKGPLMDGWYTVSKVKLFLVTDLNWDHLQAFLLAYCFPPSLIWKNIINNW